MFADTAEVQITAGDGGAGYVSFHHEKYVDKGGPDGGDGGRGGDVIFVADSGRGSLVDFRFKPNLSAKNGNNGAENNKRGRDGLNFKVKVPVGTVVYKIREKSDGTREKEQIADLTKLGEEIVIAKGGLGGFGNAHFKSSTRQTPRVAELGERGDHFFAKLELKILANVGLVGFPNAGKSTFLSVVTNAKPEIANYAFTTLKPQLGVAKVDDSEFLIADIPGLIEGAADGKGLGDEFLRHVERCEVILHLIDGMSPDIAGDYDKIRQELAKYSPKMAEKPEIIALTKLDTIDDEIAEMQREELLKVIPSGTKVFAISSVAHKNLTPVLRDLAKIVNEKRAEEEAEIRRNSDEIRDEDDNIIPVISLGESKFAKNFTVEKIGENEYEVRGEKIRKFAERTDFANIEGVNRLRDIMKKQGILHQLERQGADGKSMVHIGDSAFTLFEWEDEYEERHAHENNAPGSRKKNGKFVGNERKGGDKNLTRGHVIKHAAGVIDPRDRK